MSECSEQIRPQYPVEITESQQDHETLAERASSCPVAGQESRSAKSNSNHLLFSFWRKAGTLVASSIWKNLDGAGDRRFSNHEITMALL
jgi:hypothetical protein